MFLQVKQILELETEAAIRDLLGKLPATLEAAYDEIYEKIKTRNEHDKALADRAFKWVMCARIPLTSEALLAAILLDTDSDGFELSAEITKSQLLHLCNNLLLIDAQRKTWRVSHLSVAEYFEQNHWSRVQAHCHAAKTCLKLLLDTHGDHRNERCGIFDPQHPLQVYALSHWLNHIQAAQEGHPPDLQLAHLLKRFLGSFEETSIPYRRWHREARTQNAYYEHHIPGVARDFFIDHYDISPEDASILLACAFAIFTLLSDWWADAEINISRRNLLVTAARGGSMPICEELFRRGIANSLLAEDGPYNIALETAAGMNNTQLLEFLIDQDPELNTPVRARRLNGALAAAGAMGGSIEMVEFLVGKGANVNGPLPKRIPDTVLIAAMRGPTADMKMVRLLVDQLGAEIDMVPERQMYGSALAAAAAIGRTEVVKFLAERGADINKELPDTINGSALAAAAGGGHIKIVTFLVERGADINKTLPGGTPGSALAVAAQNGHASVAEFLLDRGAEPNMPLRHGRSASALEAAIYGVGLHRPSFVVIGRRQPPDDSALAEARSRETKMVELLIDRGADVNMRLERGKNLKDGNALETAVRLEKSHLVKLLIERGAKEL